MDVVVGFGIVARMGVVVRSVFSRVLVVVDVGIGVVRVFVHVLVKMIVGVGVGMLVAMRLAAVRVLVGVYVSVFVPMDVLVLMASFHDNLPPFMEYRDLQALNIKMVLSAEFVKTSKGMAHQPASDEPSGDALHVGADRNS